MMKLARSALLVAAAMAATVPAAAAPELELERVVMVMRHGIRPPTSATPVSSTYANGKWPEWPVDFGLLTERGAAGAKLLGASDWDYYFARGLFARGCPAAGAVRVEASAKPRAVRTAESWAQGFMPGCPVSVAHPPAGGLDPIFHGLDAHPASFDGQRAYREALASAPEGGIEAEEAAFEDDLALLAKVLGCGQPCPLLSERSELVAEDHDRPGLEGPLDIASTASQTLLLEYLEGMPMKDVGWGRVTRDQIEQLLQFHPLKFKYSNRTDYVARHAATPLAREIAGALSAPDAAKLTLLVGHDTNIADVGGFFRLHWHVPSYPADDIPPGSALGFELLRTRDGTRYVRAFYRSQTMDQLRFQQPLVDENQPFRSYLPIPGCGDSPAAEACALERFLKLIDSRILAAVPAIVHRIAGADGKWDLVSVDAEARRLLVGRGNGVMAVDLDSEKVTPVFVRGDGIHAVLVIPGTRIGVAAAREPDSAILFDADTGEIRATLPAGNGPDAASYDPATRTVWVMNAHGGTATVIDPFLAKVVATVTIGGGLELTAVDGNGRLFVNIEDQDKTAVIDTSNREVVARFPLDGCEGPTGLDYLPNGLLITSCANLVAKVLRAADGAVVGTIPIGPHPDGVFHDASRNRAYISSGDDGSLTVIDTSGAVPRLLKKLPTQASAKTGTVDVSTGLVYLPAAQLDKPAAGAKPEPIAGTFQILVVQPNDAGM